MPETASAVHLESEVLKRNTPGLGMMTGANALVTDSRSYTSLTDHPEAIAKATTCQ